MIDQMARKIAACLLNEFRLGTISNEEYERRYPESESDSSVFEIYRQIWFLYSDIREHKLTGKYKLNIEQSEFVERCILFLRNDVEFEWPSPRFNPWQSLLRFLGFREKIDEAANGEENVWPFNEKAQYEQALTNSANAFSVNGY